MTRWILFFLLVLAVPAASQSPYPPGWPYTPVVTPDGVSLPWTVRNGAKEFHLVLEEIDWELAPGMTIRAWGYNGRTPGPTIEVVQGDRVRIYVTNDLPEVAAVHWHGILLPPGMDGVHGLTQPGIEPGQTFVYEFTIDQAPGTHMYHSHADEMVQIGLGSMGFLIIHPRNPSFERVDRDFAIMLSEWFVDPATYRPDPNVMTEFNLFSMNSRVFPGTEPLIAKTGQRVRIRFGNVAQDPHPIHLHGHVFEATGTDAGPIPPSARFPETTVLVSPGQTRDIIVEKAVPGDWAMHCHRRHHPMNAMGHEDVPNMIGVDQQGVADEISELVPGYMPMGTDGMAEMATHAEHMKGPVNTLPMMAGEGPFGDIMMGGMFTILKVRDHLTEYTDRAAGWYRHKPGTVAHPAQPPGPPIRVPQKPAPQLQKEEELHPPQHRHRPEPKPEEEQQHHHHH